MRLYQKISTYFLLSLFSMIWLHAALPHVHHTHWDGAQSEEHSSGSHDSSNPIWDWLSSFLEAHTHAESHVQAGPFGTTQAQYTASSIKAVARVIASVNEASEAFLCTSQSLDTYKPRPQAHLWLIEPSIPRGPPIF